MIKAILIGNPNSGKSTFFNQITGSRQRVGNWPGVTVESKVGVFNSQGQQIELIDLPGIYSLCAAGENAAIDENIACRYLLDQNPDLLINIIDATHLERSLYLTTQLLEIGLPMMIVVNMLDLAEKRQTSINLTTLSKVFGCPVVGISARQGLGIEACKQQIVTAAKQDSHTHNVVQYSEEIEQAINEISTFMQTTTAIKPQQRRCYAIHLLENNCFGKQIIPVDICEKSQHIAQRLSKKLGNDVDIMIADQRYQTIQQQLTTCVHQKSDKKITTTEWIDNIILNRYVGIPFFLLVMYSMFLFAINIGGIFQDFFDFAGHAIFVDGLSYILTSMGFNDWLVALIAVGVGTGITTTITFIPVIGAMFLFLAFLEDSGYMARAAFVIDRFMRVLGLPGKSFVPLIVGFGCNVPAVMAARTLENRRDRILTIMMSPFMSCGARLAIYALFTAAFFPQGGQNIVFALYLIGIAMAMITGFLLRKTVLMGSPSPLLLELPSYHMPTMQSVGLHAWQRLKKFLMKAGKVIIPLCIAISFLNGVTIHGKLNTNQFGHQESLLSATGKLLTPIFSPMGIQQDNWPATVGIATGMMAKEVVVATLNTLYSQQEQTMLSANPSLIKNELKTAVQSIKDNLQNLANAFRNPITASMPENEVEDSIYGQMYQKFDGKIGAFAYLLFLLLYFPCVSTTAVMVRELNWKWSLFSVAWTTGIAYVIAVGFYQLATLIQHPKTSVLWIMWLSFMLFMVVFALRRYGWQQIKVLAK